MTTTTLNGAQRPYVERYGSALVLNTYLKIVVVLLVLLAIGQQVQMYRLQTRWSDMKPLVLRINPDGSAKTATWEGATVYTPQVAEVRHFLKRFTEHYYSRQRPTVRRDFNDALYFLDTTYREKIMGDRQVRAVFDTFRTTPSADDLEVTVDNITLSELVTPPFHAAVYLTRQAYAQGTRTARGEATRTDVQVEFKVLGPEAPAWLQDVNPIGLQITRLEGFDAFKEERR